MEVFFYAENSRNSVEMLFCLVNGGGSWFLQNNGKHA
jgi:hypothetical protein